MATKYEIRIAGDTQSYSDEYGILPMVGEFIVFPDEKVLKVIRVFHMVGAGKDMTYIVQCMKCMKSGL